MRKSLSISSISRWIKTFSIRTTSGISEELTALYDQNSFLSISLSAICCFNMALCAFIIAKIMYYSDIHQTFSNFFCFCACQGRRVRGAGGGERGAGCGELKSTEHQPSQCYGWQSRAQGAGLRGRTHLPIIPIHRLSQRSVDAASAGLIH